MYGLFTPIAALIAKRDAFLTQHSLRFDGSADYLLDTLTTTGNRKTFTYSCWVKRSAQDRYDYLFTSTTGTSTETTLRIGAEGGATDNLLNFFQWSGSFQFQIKTTATITDTEWHHVVLAVDTTQATPADRVKIYLDGGSPLAHGGTPIYMAQNADTNVNLSGNDHAIGGDSGWSFLSGQMAEVHFIDGQALDASYFGETRGGVWLPKQVTGVAYGNNGFYLDFKGNDTGVTLLLDGSSATDDLSSVNQDASITNNGSITTTSLAGPSGYGTVTALDLDGSTQYLSTTYYTSSLYDQDFTIEGWFYIDNTVGVQSFFSHRSSSSSVKDSVIPYITASSTYGLVVGDGVDWQINTTGGSVTTGWHHIAVTRNGSDYVLWVDGSSTLTGTYSGTISASGNFVIGAGSSTTPSQYFDGKIFDFRVTEGVARYTGSFTPPTSALTNTPEYLGDFGVDRTTNNNDFTVPVNTLTPDDQLLDTPNLRFATLDPANSNSDIVFEEGNLRYSTTVTSSDRVAGHTLVIPENGKVYLEVMGGVKSATYRVLGPIGFNTSIPSAGNIIGNSTGWEAYTDATKLTIRHAGENNITTNSAFYSTNYATNVYMLALDRANNAFYFGVNGQWISSLSGNTLVSSFASAGNLRTQLSTVTNIPATGTLYMASGAYKSPNDNYSGHLNFGQDHTFSGLKPALLTPYSDINGVGEFYYEPPSGFLALVTAYK